MSKRKKIKGRRSKIIIESKLKNIYVPCWKVGNKSDTSFQEKELYEKIWRMSPEEIKKYFKTRHKRVFFKYSPLLACMKKSKSKDPIHEDCFGCTKYQKYLDLALNPKRRKKIKVKVKKKRKKISRVKIKTPKR